MAADANLPSRPPTHILDLIPLLEPSFPQPPLLQPNLYLPQTQDLVLSMAHSGPQYSPSSRQHLLAPGLPSYSLSIGTSIC